MLGVWFNHFVAYSLLATALIWGIAYFLYTKGLRIHVKEGKWRKMLIALGIIMIVGGTTLVTSQFYSHKVQSQADLGFIKEQGHSLLSEISQFVADRNLSSPLVTDIGGTPEENMQKSRDYGRATDNLFITRYRLRYVDIAYGLKKAEIISEEELSHMLWFVQAQYPSIQWAIDALEKYLSRIEVTP